MNIKLTALGLLLFTVVLFGVIISEGTRLHSQLQQQQIKLDRQQSQLTTVQSQLEKAMDAVELLQSRKETAGVVPPAASSETKTAVLRPVGPGSVSHVDRLDRLEVAGVVLSCGCRRMLFGRPSPRGD